MDLLPDVVTHNYHARFGPFRNICDRPRAEAAELLAGIATLGHRRFKPDYLDRRLATEHWLMSERDRLLGTTRLQRPVYFFLGDFADGLDASRPHSIVMPLAAFPDSIITFTYPDSMTSHDLATSQKHAGDRKAYHGRVFPLSEIRAVVAEFGIPGACRTPDRSTRFDRFIEMQLWDDRPLKPYLSRRGA